MQNHWTVQFVWFQVWNLPLGRFVIPFCWVCFHPKRKMWMSSKHYNMYSKCCNQSTYLGKACEILACQKAESDGQSWAWANHLKGKWQHGVTGEDSRLHWDNHLSQHTQLWSKEDRTADKQKMALNKGCSSGLTQPSWEGNLPFTCTPHTT